MDNLLRMGRLPEDRLLNLTLWSQKAPRKNFNVGKQRFVSLQVQSSSHRGCMIPRLPTANENREGTTSVVRSAPSARNLARGERLLRTPGTHACVTNAPRRGRGELLQPLPGCISLFFFYPGVRFAHPRLISLRPAGAEFARLKSCPPVFS